MYKLIDNVARETIQGSKDKIVNLTMNRLDKYYKIATCKRIDIATFVINKK